MNKYLVNEHGFYGQLGGAFVPEMLYQNIYALKNNYTEIIQSDDFQKQYTQLLRDYVGRPTALYYAEKLSKHYNTNIYLKREDLAHTGAHKINNALGQVLLALKLKKTRIIAETGAGQHGVATATSCALLGLKCVVYMGAKDIERQHPNVKRMEMLGASVEAVRSGSQVLKDATNEAIRDWISNPVDTHYVIGSVVGPHPFPDMVARLQSIISKECRVQLRKQFKLKNPTHIIACVGGGSNAIGIYYHYLNQPNVKLIGIEAAGEGVGVDSLKTAATLTKGSVGILHGSKTYLLQTSDGQVKEAHSISAGLDYPGTGPQHAYLKDINRVTYDSVTDQEALQAAYFLSRTEGIIPALESAHALAYLEKIQFTPEDHILVNLSGRGDKDLATYEANF